MSQVSFFNAIEYRDGPSTFMESALQKVDNYFYFGGKKAIVLRGEKDAIILADGSRPACWETTLKVISMVTIIIPVIALIAKVILRSSHKFEVFDAKKELAKGMEVTQSTIDKIKSLIEPILTGKDHQYIEWLARYNNYVFKIKGLEGRVFKIGRPNRHHGKGELPTHMSPKEMQERLGCMIQAKTICITDDLAQLVIPHATCFDVEIDQQHKYTFLVEEELDVTPTDSAQEELFFQKAGKMKETVRQMAVLVARTGFDDVTPRNMPIINGDEDKVRFGLIDLEKFNKHEKSWGFTGGGNGSCGLIGSLHTEELIDVAIQVAKQEGASFDYKEAKENRMKQIAERKALAQFYLDKEIKTGREPIVIEDYSKLGLELTEKFYDHGFDSDDEDTSTIKMKTLQTAVNDVVKEVNRLIQESKDHASPIGKRSILLNTNRGIIYELHQARVERMSKEGSVEYVRVIDIVVDALIKAKYLFKLNNVNGHGYFVQA